KDYVNCSAFLSSGKLLTASGDGAAILWDVATGKESAAFIEHESGVICLDASKNSGLFATGGYDTYSKLWDVRQKESICNFSGNNSDVNAVKLFPGDRALAVASDDATCKLFDLRSFRLLNTYEHESVISTLTALLFSKSGHYLFALSEGGQLVTWDLLSGKLLDLQHGEEKLSCMDINCEGDALVVGSWDESLSVWTNDCHHGQRTLIIDPSVKEE
ncbi:Guanine nucleotide-binding protein G(I)/G(S)/G(T) subunit beta-1, partial [Bonamia ostreae]